MSRRAADERVKLLRARRAALAHLACLLRMVPAPRWATPTLMFLGIGASFAETIGITLIIVFFYSAMGQADAAGTVGGVFGEIVGRASALFGSSTRLAAVIFVLILARALLAFANSMITAYVSEKISEHARNHIHHQYLHVSYRFIQRHEQAYLMEVLGTESWLIAGAYGSLTVIIISAVSMLVFVGFLFALSWQITVTAIAGALLMSAATRFLSPMAQSLGIRVKRVHQKLGEHMLRTLEGLRTIRAYGQEEVYHRRFLQSSAEARRTAIEVTRLTALLAPLTDVGYLAVLCVIIAVSGYWGISFATTLAAVALLYRMQPYNRDIEGNLLHLAQIEPQLRSVRTMMEAEGNEHSRLGDRPVRSLRGAIRFDRVSFRYDPAGKPALRDASFDIPAGRTTALVGASGAGKTTVINLLLRLYAPTAGSICVDGVPIEELDRRDWLGLLAIAGQDVDLVEGTVIDNIRMADNDATIEQVIEASRIAGVADFIESLPEGYDTWIGQQGMRFSGGERQRVGLARAILRDPRFLLLDEATNALDKDLEARIRRAIEERFAGRTILIISHRLETLHDVDHVIRLQDGRVIAREARQALTGT